MGNSRIFITLDLASGFSQIPVKIEHCPKTAFSTHQGPFKFLKMPFGLKNAPSTFQRIINQCLSGLIGTQCLVYLDDIVIYSYDFSTHIIKLEKTFQHLREHKFLVQLDKSEFCKTEINYLGYVISDAGIQPNPDKIKCIKNFPAPTSVKQIQQFLGLTGYYRRFINHYSDLMKPLTLLLKKDTPFQWSKECEKNFQKFITVN